MTDMDMTDDEDAIQKLKALLRRIEDENPEANDARILRLYVEEALKHPDLALQMIKDIIAADRKSQH